MATSTENDCANVKGCWHCGYTGEGDVYSISECPSCGEYSVVSFTMALDMLNEFYQKNLLQRFLDDLKEMEEINFHED